MDEKLKKLLLDENYKNLKSKYFEKFNVFNVLKLQNNEIKHSNFLAWMLSPNENHGYGTNFLKDFLNINEEPQNVTIEREKEHIDILITYKIGKTYKLCLIENKIWSGENNNQLQRYAEKIVYDKKYDKYNKEFIYLTPFGSKNSLEKILSNGDKITYKQKSYKEISEILCKLIKKEKTIVDYFLEQYIEMLDIQLLRNYPNDMKLMCNAVYQKHKEFIEDIAYRDNSEIAESDKNIIRTINNVSNHRAIVFNLIKEIILEQKIDFDNISIGNKTPKKQYIRFLPDGIKHVENLKFLNDNDKRGILKNKVHIDIRQLYEGPVYIEVVVGSQTERNQENLKATKKLKNFLSFKFGEFGKVKDNWYFTKRCIKNDLFDLKNFDKYENENEIKNEIEEKLTATKIIDNLRDALNDLKSL